jgi:ribosomal protein S18 acetylase RimI-like enzyme
MLIRPATRADAPALWKTLEPVIRAGETYALPRDMSEKAALDYWLGADRDSFVAVAGTQILGTYYLRANQPGGGDHVGNCGYMTAPDARGRGVARRMCEDSQDRARTRGFRALQFNFVVSTNIGAVRLWTALGFTTIGRLPLAFHHPMLGYVDALVMFKPL